MNSCTRLNMPILINLYNQIGAGPKNISLNLISEISKLENGNDEYFIIVPNIAEYAALTPSSNITLLKLPKFESLLMKILYRVYLDLVLIPSLVAKQKIQSMLAFGNFLLSPIKIRKTVLLHHPYLFDDVLLRKLPFLAGLVERFKRFVFWATLKNVDQVVVQSPFVMTQFEQKWRSYKGDLAIIENPISNSFPKQSIVQVEQQVLSRIKTISSGLTLLYVSRFYPHKNHHFLIKLSHALAAKGIIHKILITINAEIPGAGEFLGRVAKHDLPIVNLGEIDQKALVDHYIDSHIFLFPSESETFGNPLIEAMAYGLPVVVPDAGYAHAVVGQAGIYYEIDNAEDCAEKLIGLVSNHIEYNSKSIESFGSFDMYPDATEWVRKYLEILK